MYGEKCFEYLTGYRYIASYRLIYVAATGMGAVANLELVWAFADMSNALMMIPNLIALLLLYKVIVKETNHYFNEYMPSQMQAYSKRKAG
jgi:alanine or glycine:cation symporter, AGCS family